MSTRFTAFERSGVVRASAPTPRPASRAVVAMPSVYASRTAGGSSPPTRNAFVALASAFTRFVRMVWMRTSCSALLRASLEVGVVAATIAKNADARRTRGRRRSRSPRGRACARACPTPHRRAAPEPGSGAARSARGWSRRRRVAARRRGRRRRRRRGHGAGHDGGTVASVAGRVGRGHVGRGRVGDRRGRRTRSSARSSRSCSTSGSVDVAQPPRLAHDRRLEQRCARTGRCRTPRRAASPRSDLAERGRPRRSVGVKSAPLGDAAEDLDELVVAVVVEHRA